MRWENRSRTAWKAAGDEAFLILCCKKLFDIGERHHRHCKNFAKAVFENSLSRVFIGVHWRFDGLPRKDVNGKRFGGVPLGLQIGSETFSFLT
jgi:hypothetical protein